WVRNDDMLRYWAEWAQINAQQINNVLANLSVDARINPDLYGQTVFLPKPDTVVDIAAGTSNQTKTSAGETMGGDFLLWFNGSGLMQNLASTIDPYEDPWINQGIRRGMQHEMIHLQQDGESLGALGRGQQNFLHAAMGLIT